MPTGPSFCYLDNHQDMDRALKIDPDYVEPSLRMLNPSTPPPLELAKNDCPNRHGHSKTVCQDDSPIPSSSEGRAEANLPARPEGPGLGQRAFPERPRDRQVEGFNSGSGHARPGASFAACGLWAADGSQDEVCSASAVFKVWELGVTANPAATFLLLL